MPLKSEAQRRFLHAAEARGEVPKGLAHKFEHATPKSKKARLPMHVKTASPFFLGFSDEVIKTAGLGSTIGKIPGAVGKLPGPAKAGLAGLGAAGAGFAGGDIIGKKQGIEEGESGAVDAVRQAYLMGAQRGAMSMRDMILKSMGQGVSEKE